MPNRSDYYFYDILRRLIKNQWNPKARVEGLRVANLDPLFENLTLKKDIPLRLVCSFKSIQGISRTLYITPLNRSLILFAKEDKNEDRNFSMKC